MNAAGVNNPSRKEPTQNTMQSSTTDQFNKQLGAHGYLQHSKKGPGNYGGSEEHPYMPNDTQSDMTKEEQEPYTRVAGKSLPNKPPYGNFSQNRNLGARNINRRIVEDNLLRNASAERERNVGNESFRNDSIPHNHSFQHKYNNTLDQRMADFYQNPPQKPQAQYRYDPKEETLQQNEDKENEDRYLEHENQYIKEFYHQHDNRNEQTQTPDPNEEHDRGRGLAKNQTFGNRDRSVQPQNSVKYNPPEVSKSVQFRQAETIPAEPQHESYSRLGNRSKEVVQDVGELYC